jgi:hypothetical protein
MANNFDSNFTRKLARVFLEKFENNRVMSKNVDTQLLSGRFAPDTGETVDFKRPTDYKSTRTSNGDVSGGTAESIITGKASGTVQDYFTVEVDFDEADEALKMDQLDELLAPMATRIVTDMELDFAEFMMKNSGLLAGTYGEGVSTWDEVSLAGSLMQASGVPMDGEWCYALNPYSQRSLASNQRSLGAGGEAGGLIATAHQRATISENFAGMRVMTATTLPSITSTALTDRAGVIGSIDVTYLTAKDTMTQQIAITGLEAQANLIPAGSVVQIAGRNRLNMSTRKPIIDDTQSNVLYTGVVTQDATTSAAGAVTLTVSGPAIYEADGAYNTVDSAPTAGDVITILGGASTLYQPNLFWHKKAFSIGSVPIKKLYSTDTLATTEDGLQIRVSKGASFRENKQLVRFDLRPAYGVMNPFFAGQGFGTA